MFRKISIKDFRVEHPNTAVLGGDVLGTIKFLGKQRRGKLYKEDVYSLKVLEHLIDGAFYGLFPDLEYKKARHRVGRKRLKKLVSSKIRKNERARGFLLGVGDYLDEYERKSAYGYLFKLTRDKNMHWANLTSIIAGIELDVPIVSNDSHFYTQRKNIHDAYRKRHKEESGSKEVKIYDSQYFVKNVLSDWDG